MPELDDTILAGADGLIVEVHYDPDKAFSDGAQTLFMKQYDDLVKELKIIATAVKRTL